MESYGDLNGDGFLDIIAFSEYNNFSISMNNNGIFSDDSLIHVTGGCDGGRKAHLLVDDFNNDGKTDAVGIHGFDAGGIGPIPFILCRTFKMLKNIGEGAYSINQIYSEQIEGASVLLYFNGSNSFDYDSDKFIDIVCPGIKLRNNGNETFSYISGFSPFSVSQSNDFNGDGSMDLVSGFNYYSIVPLWTNINDGNGNFTQFTSNDGKFYTLTSGDFDKDGDIDIAGYDNSILEISILLNGDVFFILNRLFFTPL
ncbi:MAG TPA: VCBS repeat-containing protein [Ignavibacteria bacterium]|nr:VCBS repeat-containing protein [Ignavibacteria bacterium]